MIIYPSKTVIRDTDRGFEIDDNDPSFHRDPTGLFAIYTGVEPTLLLRSTETEGHWDIVGKFWSYHLEKLTRLFSSVQPISTNPNHNSENGVNEYRSD